MTTDNISLLPDMEQGYPQWLADAFPLTFIFYRAKKPRMRKRHVGWKVKAIYNEEGKRKIQWQKVMAEYAKVSTKQQNNYSYIACCLRSPDDYGAVKRSFKHKGYGKLIAVVYSTQREKDRQEECWRYIGYKYKSMEEFYNVRQLNDPQLKDLCERLGKVYPSRCSGQLRLL
ncbi:MAG: hypothetical protein DI539_21390 [Flavobacterium psychrophilum]|nr:MAG: hypothetical protein DI539_21390 [Flavobacterium psychrophilum]